MNKGEAGGKQSKTSRVSSGKKGDKGRTVLCPQHGGPLVPAILIPAIGKKRDGWICGAKGIGNIERDDHTHYLTITMEEWNG